MPANNFKLFDENKQNMLSDQEYQASQQRLGGVQAGIASSMLNNKFAYQMSLIAYAIAQMMNANGYDATDALAVSAFVGNLSNSVLQKVIDKATTAEAQAGTNALKWMTPALVKSFFDYRLATQAEAQAGTNNSKWMSPLRVAQAMAATNTNLTNLWQYARSKRWTLSLNRTTAGSFTYTVPANVYQLGITLGGGGQAGFGGIGRNSSEYSEAANASGGRAGQIMNYIMAVSPGQVISGVVGAGGVSVAVPMPSTNRVFSKTTSAPGGTTTFGGMKALGGGVVENLIEFGLSSDSCSGADGTGNRQWTKPSTKQREIPWSLSTRDLDGGSYSEPVKTLSASVICGILFDCWSWFESIWLGATGGAANAKISGANTGTIRQIGSEVPGFGKGGNGVATAGTSVSSQTYTGENATGNCNGGGACAVESATYNASVYAKGGNGAPGIARIYIETGV